MHKNPNRTEPEHEPEPEPEPEPDVYRTPTVNDPNFLSTQNPNRTEPLSWRNPNPTWTQNLGSFPSLIQMRFDHARRPTTKKSTRSFADSRRMVDR